MVTPWFSKIRVGVMKRWLGWGLGVVLLGGCASVVPPSTETVTKSALAPQCQALFADAKYQDYAQWLHMTPVFAVAFGEDRQNMVCAYAAQNLLSVIWHGNREIALQRCEDVRSIWVYQSGVPLAPCRVFAEGNTIIKEQ